MECLRKQEADFTKEEIRRNYIANDLYVLAHSEEFSDIEVNTIIERLRSPMHMFSNAATKVVDEVSD